MADAIVPNTDEQGTGAVEATQATAAVQGTGVVGQTTATGTLGGTGDPLAVDTTQLSETAQVVLLEQQGLNVSEISKELGIPPIDVEGDLGEVVNAQQTANTQPTQGTAAAAYSQVAGI